MSFLQGNYVTLTNMSDYDLDRIIKFHLSPINVSFQTMNPKLRCKMLHNRFAGDALAKVDRLYKGDVTMNGQIVLCKGINDRDELEYSLEKLSEYAPVLQSVSIVPVGLSRYRKGLYPLESFDKEDARLHTAYHILPDQKVEGKPGSAVRFTPRPADHKARCVDYVWILNVHRKSEAPVRIKVLDEHGDGTHFSSIKFEVHNGNQTDTFTLSSENGVYENNRGERYCY